MIKKYEKEYCATPELIENYWEAKNDPNEYWHCHHRLENTYSGKELKQMHLYYGRKPEDLIFIRASEHNNNPSIHIEIRRKNKRMKGKPAWNKGKETGPLSEETKQKMAESHKGINLGNQNWRKRKSRNKPQH